MVRPTEIEIIHHISLESLKAEEKKLSESLQSMKKTEKLLTRVQFVRLRYSGFSVEEASKAVGFTTKTGYNVQKAWNSSGMEGLIPDFKGGPRSKLTNAQKKQLYDALSLCQMDTKTVLLYINNEFGIKYSEKQVRVILKSMGMRHAKPYPRDHRRPADAEAVLKKDSRMLWMPSTDTIS